MLHAVIILAKLVLESIIANVLPARIPLSKLVLGLLVQINSSKILWQKKVALVVAIFIPMRTL
jgi:hypothetical protein